MAVGARVTVILPQTPPAMSSQTRKRARYARSICLAEELLAVRQLLSDHADDADHREAAVVDLLGLHLLELGGAGGLEAERVPAQVAVGVCAQRRGGEGARLRDAI